MRQSADPNPILKTGCPWAVARHVFGDLQDCQLSIAHERLSARGRYVLVYELLFLRPRRLHKQPTQGRRACRSPSYGRQMDLFHVSHVGTQHPWSLGIGFMSMLHAQDSDAYLHDA